MIPPSQHAAHATALLHKGLHCSSSLLLWVGDRLHEDDRETGSRVKVSLSVACETSTLSALCDAERLLPIGPTTLVMLSHSSIRDVQSSWSSQEQEVADLSDCSGTSYRSSMNGETTLKIN